VWPRLALNSQILQPSRVKITLAWLNFHFLNGSKKKRRIIFCDKWKRYEIQVDTISKVLFEHSYLTHFHVTHDCSCSAAAELSGCDRVSTQPTESQTIHSALRTRAGNSTLSVKGQKMFARVTFTLSNSFRATLNMQLCSTCDWFSYCN
jgi:hypothetical protein